MHTCRPEDVAEYLAEAANKSSSPNATGREMMLNAVLIMYVSGINCMYVCMLDYVCM